MRSLIAIVFFSVLCGCASAPQIPKNDTSATVFVKAPALEAKSFFPDEVVFFRVFFPGQSLEKDRPLTVVTLKPNQTSGSFNLNSGVSYVIELRAWNPRATGKDECISVVEITPLANQDYQMFFDTHAPNDQCSIVFQAGEEVLVEETFSKKKIYNILIPIPVPL